MIIVVCLFIGLYSTVGAMELDPVRDTIQSTLEPFERICFDIFLTLPETSAWIEFKEKLHSYAHDVIRVDIQTLHLNPRGVIQFARVSHAFHDVVNSFTHTTLHRADILRYILLRKNGLYAHKKCAKSLHILFSNWCKNNYFKQIIELHNLYHTQLLQELTSHVIARTHEHELEDTYELSGQLAHIVPAIIPEYRSEKAVDVKNYIGKHFVDPKKRLNLEKLKLAKIAELPSLRENTIQGPEFLEQITQAIKMQPSVVFDKCFAEENILHIAALCGTNSVIDVMLASGINVDVRCWEGKSPLYKALSLGNKTTVELLLNAQADPNMYSYYHNSAPIIVAAQTGYQDLIELLYTNKANINAQDAEGYTPLHWAIIMEKHHAISKLLKLGADCAIKNDRDMTPLQEAQSRGRGQIVKLLGTFLEPAASLPQL